MSLRILDYLAGVTACERNGHAWTAPRDIAVALPLWSPEGAEMLFRAREQRCTVCPAQRIDIIPRVLDGVSTEPKATPS